MNPQIMIFAPSEGMLKLDYNIEVTTEQMDRIISFIAGLAGKEAL